MKSFMNYLFGLFLSMLAPQGRLIEYRDNLSVIELPANKLAPVCEDDPDSTTSFFGVEGVLDSVFYDFYFRSPVDHELCHELMVEYQDLIDKAKKPLRITGEGAIEGPYKAYAEPPALLAKLGPFRKQVAAPFLRLESDSNCLPYFNGGCSPTHIAHLITGKIRPKP